MQCCKRIMVPMARLGDKQCKKEHTAQPMNKLTHDRKCTQLFHSARVRSQMSFAYTPTKYAIVGTALNRASWAQIANPNIVRWIAMTEFLLDVSGSTGLLPCLPEQTARCNCSQAVWCASLVFSFNISVNGLKNILQTQMIESNHSPFSVPYKTHIVNNNIVPSCSTISINSWPFIQDSLWL